MCRLYCFPKLTVGFWQMRRQMVITMYNNNSIQQQTHGNKTDVTSSFMLQEKNQIYCPLLCLKYFMC